MEATKFKAACPTCGTVNVVTLPKFNLITSFVCGVCSTALEAEVCPNTGVSVGKTYGGCETHSNIIGEYIVPVNYVEHLQQQLEVSEFEQDFERCASLRDKIADQKKMLDQINQDGKQA